ncbi:bifunctional nuclease family protein [bacterium]|nr:bifunctional nuclease family protein [bacterium]
MKLLIIDSLAIDAKSNDMVIVLRVEDNDEILPIWIGNIEALSIALSLSNTKPLRPLSHDLIVNISRGFEAEIQRVVITALIENTYYALVYFQREKDLIVVDSRPSDAIALALRVGAPIFLKDEIPTVSADLENEERRKLELRLKRIDPKQIVGG